MGKSSSGRHQSGSQGSSRSLRRTAEENGTRKGRHDTDSISTSSRRGSRRHDTEDDDEGSTGASRSAETTSFTPILTAEPSEISGTYYTAQNGSEESGQGQSRKARKSDRQAQVGGRSEDLEGDNDKSLSKEDSQNGRRQSRKSSKTERKSSTRAYEGNEASLPQNQFPGEFPATYTEPYRPPGLAADYYGDNGESVAQQPGVRPNQPSIITSADQMHLMEPTPDAKPPPEPSSLGQVGAAASYFGSAGFESESGVQSTPSKPSQKPNLRPGRPLKHSQTGTSPRSSPGPQGSHSIPGSAPLGLAAEYYAGGSLESTNGPAYQTPSLPPPGAQVPPAPFSAPAEFGGHQQHSNAAMLGGSALAGAAAGAYMSAHSHHGQFQSQHHSSGPNAQPSLHGRPHSHLAQGQTQQVHRHKRRGPLGKLVDWFRDPDAVAEYEQYTEAIGVCKYCFDPTTSPADAPRRHHYHPKRRSSGGPYGSTSRVDKTYRYSSDEERRRRSGAKKAVAGGLAGYGAAKIGEAMYKSKHDFDDTYSVRSGRPINQSRVSFQDDERSYQRRSQRYTPSEGPHRRDHDISHSSSKVHSQSQRRRSTRRDSSSSSSSRGVSRGAAFRVAAAGAAGLAMGAADSGRSRRDRSRSPKQKRYYSKRVSPMHSYVDLSTTNEGTGGLLGFFTSPSANKKKGHKDKGFFNFGNASSSSSDADLAFGAATVRRKNSNKRLHNSKRRSTRLDSSEAIMGLVATGEALAAESVQRDKRGKQRFDADVAVGRHGTHTGGRRVSTQSNHDSMEGNDDEWYDTDDDDNRSSSSVDSALAYGGSVSALHSRESLVQKKGSTKPTLTTAFYDSTTSGRQRQRHDGTSRRLNGNDSSAFNIASAEVLAAGATAAGALAASYGYNEMRPASSSRSDLPPMREVEPRPISDHDFNASRSSSRKDNNESMSSVSEPRKVSATSVPLQQPQPVVPVAPFFQENEFGPTSKSGRHASTDFSSATDDYRDGGRQVDLDSKRQSRRSRRDSSPAKLPSQDQKSNVNFSLTEAQLQNEERADERGSTWESGRDDKRRRRSAEVNYTGNESVAKTNPVQDKTHAEGKRPSDSRHSSLDSSDERVAEIERELKRLYAEQHEAEEREKRRRNERSSVAVATGAAAAVAATVALGAKGKSSNSPNEEGTPRRRSSLKKSKEREASPPVETQQERIARMAAQRVRSTPSPVHEDYSSFFVPQELQEHLKEHNAQAEHRDDMGANVVEIVPGAALSRPRHPFDPFTYRPFGLSLEDDPSSHPWAVPMLELIEPTPPGSQTHSVRGDTSPLVTPHSAKQVDDVGAVVGKPLERKTSNGSKVTWGDHDTYVYEVQTPEYEHSDYMPEVKPRCEAEPPDTHRDHPSSMDEGGKSRPAITRVWTLEGDDAERLEKEVPVVDDRPHISHAWTVDDTEADQIERDTHRRPAASAGDSSDPTSISANEESSFRTIYQGSFAETISDLGVNGKIVEDSHPGSTSASRTIDQHLLRQGIENESQGVTEKLRDVGVQESAPPARASKSEKRRQERASSSREPADSMNNGEVPHIPGSDSVFDYLADSEDKSAPPSQPHIDATPFDDPMQPSSRSDSVAHYQSDPEEWERQKETKKSKKAKRTSKSDVGSGRKSSKRTDQEVAMAEPEIGRVRRSRTLDDVSDLQAKSEVGRSKRKSKHSSTSLGESELVDNDDQRSNASVPLSSERNEDKKSGGFFSSLFSSNKSDISTSSKKSSNSSKSDSRPGRDIDDRRTSRGKRSSQDLAFDPGESAASEPSRSRRASMSRNDSQASKSREQSVEDGFVSAEEDTSEPGKIPVEDESFLAERPEMPPPMVTTMPMDIDGVSGLSTEKRPSRELHTEAVVTPTLQPETVVEVNKPHASGQEEHTNLAGTFPLTDAESSHEGPHPSTPQYASSQRLSALRTGELPSSPMTASSPTAVPLHFRRPPVSPTSARFSMSSPIASPVSPLTTPRTRQGRPKSTEFRSSKEFRPLYLVERQNFAKTLDPEPSEEYPSLPSSRTSSANASTENLRAEAQTQEYNQYTPSRISAEMFRDRGRRHSYSYWHDEKRRESPDYLDSRSATPVPNEAQRARDSEKKPKPKYEFHSPSELLQDPAAYGGTAFFDEADRPTSPLPSVVSTDADQDYMSARSRSPSPIRARSVSRGRSKSTSRSTSAAWEDAMTTTAAGFVIGSVLAVGAHEALKSPGADAWTAEASTLDVHDTSSTPGTPKVRPDPSGDVNLTHGEDVVSEKHLALESLQSTEETPTEAVEAVSATAGQHGAPVEPDVAETSRSASTDLALQADIAEFEEPFADFKTKMAKKDKKKKRPRVPSEAEVAASITALGDDNVASSQSWRNESVSGDTQLKEASFVEEQVPTVQAEEAGGMRLPTHKYPTEAPSAPDGSQVKSGMPDTIGVGYEPSRSNDASDISQNAVVSDQLELSPFEEAFDAAIAARGLTKGSTVEDAFQSLQPDYSEEQEHNGTPLTTIDEANEVTPTSGAEPTIDQLGRKLSKKEKRKAKKSSKGLSDAVEGTKESSALQMEVPTSKEPEAPDNQADLSVGASESLFQDKNNPNPFGNDFEIREGEPIVSNDYLSHDSKVGPPPTVAEGSEDFQTPADEQIGDEEWPAEVKKGKKGKKDKKNKKKKGLSWDDEGTNVEKSQVAQDAVPADVQTSEIMATTDALPIPTAQTLAEPSHGTSADAVQQEIESSIAAQPEADDIWAAATTKGKKSKRKSVAWTDNNSEAASAEVLLSTPLEPQTYPSVDNNEISGVSLIEKAAALASNKHQDSAEGSVKTSDEPAGKAAAAEESRDMDEVFSEPTLVDSSEDTSPAKHIQESTADAPATLATPTVIASIDEQLAQESLPQEEVAAAILDETQNEDEYFVMPTKKSKKDKKKRRAQTFDDIDPLPSGGETSTAGNVPVFHDGLESATANGSRDRATVPQDLDSQTLKEADEDGFSISASKSKKEKKKGRKKRLTLDDDTAEGQAPESEETMKQPDTTRPLPVEETSTEEPTVEVETSQAQQNLPDQSASSEFSIVEPKKSKKEKRKQRNSTSDWTLMQDETSPKPAEDATEKTVALTEGPDSRPPDNDVASRDFPVTDKVTDLESQKLSESSATTDAPSPTAETSTAEDILVEALTAEPSTSKAPAAETPGGETAAVDTFIATTPQYEALAVETHAVETSAVDTSTAETPAFETPANESFGMDDHSAVADGTSDTPRDSVTEPMASESGPHQILPEANHPAEGGSTDFSVEPIPTLLKEDDVETTEDPFWEIPVKKSKKDKRKDKKGDKRLSALQTETQEPNHLGGDEEARNQTTEDDVQPVESALTTKSEEPSHITQPSLPDQASPEEVWNPTTKIGKKDKKKKRQSTIETAPRESEDLLPYGEDVRTTTATPVTSEAVSEAPIVMPSDEVKALATGDEVEQELGSARAVEGDNIWNFTSKKSKKDRKKKKRQSDVLEEDPGLLEQPEEPKTGNHAPPSDAQKTGSDSQTAGDRAADSEAAHDQVASAGVVKDKKETDKSKFDETKALLKDVHVPEGEGLTEEFAPEESSHILPSIDFPVPTESITEVAEGQTPTTTVDFTLGVKVQAVGDLDPQVSLSSQEPVLSEVGELRGIEDQEAELQTQVDEPRVPEEQVEQPITEEPGLISRDLTELSSSMKKPSHQTKAPESSEILGVQDQADTATDEWTIPIKKSKKDKKKKRQATWDEVAPEPDKLPNAPQEKPESLMRDEDAHILTQAPETFKTGINEQITGSPETGEFNIPGLTKKGKTKKKRQSILEEALDHEAVVSQEPEDIGNVPAPEVRETSDTGFTSELLAQSTDRSTEPAIKDEWGMSNLSKKEKKRKKKRQSTLDEGFIPKEDLEPAAEQGQDLLAPQSEPQSSSESKPHFTEKPEFTSSVGQDSEDTWAVKTTSKQDKKKKKKQQDTDNEGILESDQCAPSYLEDEKQKDNTPSDDQPHQLENVSIPASKAVEDRSLSPVVVENNETSVALTDVNEKGQHEELGESAIEANIKEVATPLEQPESYPSSRRMSDKNDDEGAKQDPPIDYANAGTKSPEAPDMDTAALETRADTVDSFQSTPPSESEVLVSRSRDVSMSEVFGPSEQAVPAEEPHQGDWDFSTAKTKKDKKKKRKSKLDAFEPEESPIAPLAQPDANVDNQNLDEPLPTTDATKDMKPEPNIDEEWSVPMKKSKKEKRKSKQVKMQEIWDEPQPQDPAVPATMDSAPTMGPFKSFKGGDDYAEELAGNAGDTQPTEMPQQENIGGDIDQDSVPQVESREPEVDWDFSSKKLKKDKKKKKQATLVDSFTDEPVTLTEPEETSISKAAAGTILPADPKSADVGPEDDWSFTTKKGKKAKKSRGSFVNTDLGKPETDTVGRVEYMHNDPVPTKEASEPSKDEAGTQIPPQGLSEAAEMEASPPASRKKSKKDKKKKALAYWAESEQGEDNENTETSKQPQIEAEPPLQDQDSQEPRMASFPEIEARPLASSFEAALEDPDKVTVGTGDDLEPAGSAAVAASIDESVEQTRSLDVADVVTNDAPAGGDPIHKEPGSDGMWQLEERGVSKDKKTKNQNRQFEFDGTEVLQETAERKGKKNRRQFEFTGDEVYATRSLEGLGPAQIDEAEPSRAVEHVADERQQSQPADTIQPQEDEETMSDVSASTRERRKRRRSPPAWSGQEPDDLPTSRALTPPPDHDDIMDTALVVAAGLGIGNTEHAPLREASRKSTSPVRQPSAGWSFAQLGKEHENRDSGIQIDSPMLTQGQISSTRDSGFVQGVSEKADEDMDVSLRPPRPHSPTSSTEDVSQVGSGRGHQDERAILETPRRKPSPVESTSKDRSSALFNSSPAMPTPIDTRVGERSSAAVLSPLRRSPSIHGHHLSREELKHKAKSPNALGPSDMLASSPLGRSISAEVNPATIETHGDHPFSPRSSLNTIREETADGHSRPVQTHPFAEPPVSLAPQSRSENSRLMGAAMVAGTAAALAMQPRDLGPAKSLGNSKSRTSSLRSLRGSSDQLDRSVHSPPPNWPVHDQDPGKAVVPRDRDMADVYVSI